MGKLEAHQKGELHRAISVLIFNSKGEMLLQQRAAEKYHSAGLWSNTCCTHPNPKETTLQASSRRLMEEMGIKSDLSHLYSFIYKVHLDNGLIENELDHVYLGISDELPRLNPNEVSNYRYTSIQKIQEKMESTPEQYSAWFQLIFAKLLELKPEIIAA